VGFGYSSGALIGAWFGVYVWWAHKIPAISRIEHQDMWLSLAVILTIGAVLTFVSLLFSPETKDVQLSEVKGGLEVPEVTEQPDLVPAD
jgi:hypothetical protein